MTKTTVVAPANIAFIKYWGKRSRTLRIPLNDSLSMNLSCATTTTTVEFSSQLVHDEISCIGEVLSENEQERISIHLDRIRKTAHTQIFARVMTKNSFPKGTGIASSASGFAALTVAATRALDVHMSEKEITILARIGSGSACRSVPDGFVWWHAGRKSSDSYAESLYSPTWWSLRDTICVVSKEAKKTSSTEGMDAITTSPYWKTRIQEVPEKIEAVKRALQNKDIHALGVLIEEDAISMHCVMMTQSPPVFYWNDTTLRIMDEVYELRRKGIAAYYTIDAGPNVHIICEANNEDVVFEAIKNIPGVQSVIQNGPDIGAHCISHHLF